MKPSIWCGEACSLLVISRLSRPVRFCRQAATSIHSSRGACVNPTSVCMRNTPSPSTQYHRAAVRGSTDQAADQPRAAGEHALTMTCCAAAAVARGGRGQLAALCAHLLCGRQASVPQRGPFHLRPAGLQAGPVTQLMMPLTLSTVMAECQAHRGPASQAQGLVASTSIAGLCKTGMRNLLVGAAMASYPQWQLTGVVDQMQTALKGYLLSTGSVCSTVFFPAGRSQQHCQSTYLLETCATWLCTAILLNHTSVLQRLLRLGDEEACHVTAIAQHV